MTQKAGTELPMVALAFGATDTEATPVDATHPLPVTLAPADGESSGLATELKQDAANASLVSIDTKMSAATPAGSAIIGKVGIDQTTPGTSNLVAAGQSGAWNITNISGTVSLPTGAATVAKQPALGVAGTPSADVISTQDPLWKVSDLTGLRINTAASGVTALVAAVSGQTTRVHRLRLSVAGAVIVQVRDGATILEVFNFAGNGGSVNFDFSDRAWYTTTANTALNLNLSAAVQVDGRLEYVTSA